MMNERELDLTTYFGNVTISEIDRNEKRVHGPVQETRNFINNLPCDVVVELRSGIKFTVSATRSLTNAKFIVRVGINLSSYAREEAQRVLSGLNHSTATPELKVMRDALQFQIERNHYRSANLSLDYNVTFDELTQCGGSIYHYEMDCVISISGFQDTPPHPYSERGKRNRILFNQETEVGKGKFQYCLEIVDNLAKYGDRYINLGGVVYKITPRHDPTMRDGVYIVSSAAIKSGRDNSKPMVKYYPFDDTDMTPVLYRTYDDALASGDVIIQRKYEIASIEHEVTLLKQQALRDKLEHEEMIRQRDATIKEIETHRERHALDLSMAREKAEAELALEKMRLKDHYEEKSHRRKDQSEVVKWIPSIIIGIGGIFVAIKALKK